MVSGAEAADKPSNGITGVYLTTRYPALTVRAGETTTIDLSLRNFNHPPQQLALSVPDVAQGWKATILGGGQPVESAIVAPDTEEKLQLRLEPPATTGPGEYHFLVAAKGEGSDLKLPITVTIGQELPAKLKLTTNFPSLRGTATTSFKFRVTVANDSGRDATINFSADAPKNFQVTFTEAYGSQQLTSIPIEAGKSKDIEASVALPRDTPAGDYKLALHAKSEAASADLDLAITVLGQARLALAGEGGRLSGEAYAGQDGQLTVVVRNDGSEAARDVDFSATAPEGWKTSFDPKQLPELAAGKSQPIKVSLTPSPRAIAGD
ncbi:MAG TPA: NEW3 domain-containing protein, partial [Stellaceae bacterium]|nr:NEW3 domain-containing protein [Stellaceae bacterium]